MFLVKLAAIGCLLFFGRTEAHWIGEEYWTIIDYSGAITDGRITDDFLEIPGPDGGTTPDGWVAYWITRTKYPEIHYEAFGHAIRKDDGRICGYFVGDDEEVVEVCGGFRILSRHRTDRSDRLVFQWVLASHVTNREDTVGFILHRIASTRFGEQIIYGDAMLTERRFKGVRPAVFDDSIIKIDVNEFSSQVYLLIKVTPEVGPVQTGHYEGHYHDPHTDHRVHGRNGHPLPRSVHRPQPAEVRRPTVCNSGWYGRDCLSRCSEGCELPETCDYTSGYCSRCKYGWYGPGCTLRCADGCERCDQSTGQCLSCRYGWYGRNCSVRCADGCERCDPSTGQCLNCRHGWFGRDCTVRCPANCDTCEPSTGQCLRCKYGWYGRDCSTRCPVECETCDQNGQCIAYRAPAPQPTVARPLPKGCHRVVTNDGREFVSCYPYHRHSDGNNNNPQPRVIDPSDGRLKDPRADRTSQSYDPLFDPRSLLYDPRYNPFDPQYEVEKDREWRLAHGFGDDLSNVPLKSIEAEEKEEKEEDKEEKAENEDEKEGPSISDPESIAEEDVSTEIELEDK